MTDLSNRGYIDPFFAMDILTAANKKKASGHSVISMAVGQPASACPQIVIQTAMKALKDGHIGYTDALGHQSLKERIAQYYFNHHNIKISSERIAITTGSSAGFTLAFLSYFDAGDRVAITRPGYPAYRNIMKVLGIEVVEIDTKGTGILTAELIKAAHEKTPLKGVLFASPANPTGAIIPKDELRKIMHLAENLNIHVISDEIYHRLNFISPDTTALGFNDNVTVINSFSKYYCMTGWRIGWMVLPQKAIRAVERISQSLYISAPELSQLAAVSAFDAVSELEKNKDTYRINREYLTQKLPQLGFKLLAPMDGAFYAYCDASKFTNDTLKFSQKILQDIDVAITPGIDFDPVEGHKSLRFSYAGSTEAIKLAFSRLENWLI